MANTETIKNKLRKKYTTLEGSGINRHTFYDWSSNGLPKSVKRFFEIAKKADIDPSELYEIFTTEETK